MIHPILGEVNDMVHRTPPTHYFPGRQPEPTYVPPAPRGRWEWVPDNRPYLPSLPFDCPACRNGGICMCVRPERDVFWVDGNGPGKTFTMMTVTSESTGSLKLG